MVFRSRRRTTTIRESSVVQDGRLKALEWAKKNLDGFRPPAKKIMTREEVAAARAKAYAWAEMNGLIPSAPEYNRDEDESAGADDFHRRRSGFGPPIPSAPGPFAPEKRDESAGNNFRGRAASWSSEF
jgi:hypothetical protein